MDYTQFNSYSETEQKAIKQVVEGNKNFYTSFGISDLPFVEMEVLTEDNITAIKPFVIAYVTFNDTTYTITLRKSTEQKCWFIIVDNGVDSYSGIVNYNSVLSWNRLFAFVILNSNEGNNFDDITNTIQYSNFMILEK